MRIAFCFLVEVVIELKGKFASHSIKIVQCFSPISSFFFPMNYFSKVFFLMVSDGVSWKTVFNNLLTTPRLATRQMCSISASRMSLKMPHFFPRYWNPFRPLSQRVTLQHTFSSIFVTYPAIF